MTINSINSDTTFILVGVLTTRNRLISIKLQAKITAQYKTDRIEEFLYSDNRRLVVAEIREIKQIDSAYKSNCIFIAITGYSREELTSVGTNPSYGGTSEFKQLFEGRLYTLSNLPAGININ